MNKKLKESKNDTTERIMGLAALAIIVLGLTIIISFVWLGGTTKWMNTVGFVLLADMFLCFLLSIVLRPIKNKKIIKAVYNAAHWNAKAWGFLVALVLPAILILLGLLLIVVIPFVLVFGLLKLLSEAVTINPHTVLFGAISIGSIISAHHSRPMFWCIFKFLTMNHHRYEEHLKRMVEYVYRPTNLQVVVCFLYVVYLVVSTVYKFQTGGQPLWDKETDLAVLESFLVFIAYSNMRTRRESADFRFSELFKIMCAIWTTHDYLENDYDTSEQK